MESELDSCNIELERVRVLIVDAWEQHTEEIKQAVSFFELSDDLYHEYNSVLCEFRAVKKDLENIKQGRFGTLEDHGVLRVNAVHEKSKSLKIMAEIKMLAKLVEKREEGIDVMTQKLKTGDFGASFTARELRSDLAITLPQLSHSAPTQIPYYPEPKTSMHSCTSTLSRYENVAKEIEMYIANLRETREKKMMDASTLRSQNTTMLDAYESLNREYNEYLDQHNMSRKRRDIFTLMYKLQTLRLQNDRLHERHISMYEKYKKVNVVYSKAIEDYNYQKREMQNTREMTIHDHLDDSPVRSRPTKSKKSVRFAETNEERFF